MQKIIVRQITVSQKITKEKQMENKNGYSKCRKVGVNK